MEENWSEDVKRALTSWFSDVRRVVIVGAGNPLRRDDSVGIEIVRKLKNKTSSKVYLVEGETLPESFIEPIVSFKPTHILIIDAALLNLPPGSMRLIEPEEIGGITLSTHTLPLSIFCGYLSQETGAKVALLVIQPEETEFGEGLTEKLKNTAEKVVNLLSEILDKV